MHICVNVQNRLMSRCLFNMRALLVMDARPCAMEARPSHVKGSLGGGGESVLTASTKPITTIADEMGIGRELKVVDGNPREALYSVRGEICVLLVYIRRKRCITVTDATDEAKLFNHCCAAVGRCATIYFHAGVRKRGLSLVYQYNSS